MNPQSRPWEISARETMPKGSVPAVHTNQIFVQKESHSRGVAPIIFCSLYAFLALEVQYFYLLFVKMYNSVTLCLSVSPPGALGSAYSPEYPRISFLIQPVPG